MESRNNIQILQNDACTHTSSMQILHIVNDTISESRSSDAHVVSGSINSYILNHNEV